MKIQVKISVVHGQKKLSWVSAWVCDLAWAGKVIPRNSSHVTHLYILFAKRPSGIFTTCVSDTCPLQNVDTNLAPLLNSKIYKILLSQDVTKVLQKFACVSLFSFWFVVFNFIICTGFKAAYCPWCKKLLFKARNCSNSSPELRGRLPGSMFWRFHFFFFAEFIVQLPWNLGFAQPIYSNESNQPRC